MKNEFLALTAEDNSRKDAMRTMESFTYIVSIGCIALTVNIDSKINTKFDSFLDDLFDPFFVTRSAGAVVTIRSGPPCCTWS